MENATAYSIKDTDTVEFETLDSVFAHWQPDELTAGWNCIFVLPIWLKAWWSSFGSNNNLYLLTVRQNQRVIGIAPLMRNDRTARLIGDRDVCDCLDFVVAPNRAAEFYGRLILQLRQDGVTRLDLGLIRPDSSAYTGFLPLAEKMGCRIHCEPAETSYELELPGSWHGYLDILSGKQRHEIRRKLRRLEKAGKVDFRLVDDPTRVRTEMNIFFKLFQLNRPDKAAFMTDQMNAFFRNLAARLAEWGLLRLFFLELDDKPIAAAMCFDYQLSRYLYNSGYDSSYSNLSAGLLSKVFSIQQGIQAGIKTYDFLNGAEPYKRRLGGQPITLYQCRLELA